MCASRANPSALAKTSLNPRIKPSEKDQPAAPARVAASIELQGICQKFGLQH